MVATTADAATADPPGWPWRGVNMDSISSTPADIGVLLTRLGANSIHLQLRPEVLGNTKHLDANEAWTRAIAWANAMLDACKQYHIVGIVEVTGVPLGKVDTSTETEPAFWANPSAREEYFRRLASLAKNLRSRGHEFAAYDIMSEPVMIVAGKSFKPPQWQQFQLQIINTLRTYDPSRWVVVKPGPWGLPASYENLGAIARPRLIYSVHMYDPHRFTHQGIKHYPFGPKYPGYIGSRMWDARTLEMDLTPVIRFQQKYKVPVYVGEFSAARWAPGADTYIKNLVTIFNDHGWGWAYFAYSGWNGWNPNYNTHYSTDASGVDRDYVGVQSKRWKVLRQILPIEQPIN